MTTVDQRHLFFTWLAVGLTLEVLIAHQFARRLKPWRYWMVWSGLVQYIARYLAQFTAVEVVKTAGFRALTTVLFIRDSGVGYCSQILHPALHPYSIRTLVWWVRLLYFCETIHWWEEIRRDCIQCMWVPMPSLLIESVDFMMKFTFVHPPPSYLPPLPIWVWGEQKANWHQYHRHCDASLLKQLPHNWSPNRLVNMVISRRVFLYHPVDLLVAIVASYH